MKIQYVTGDLLQLGPRHIAHGVNAQGVMGSGVAGLLRKRSPEVFKAYRNAYETKGNSLELGDVIWADTDYDRVANLVSQEFYGNAASTGHVYVSYEAIEMGMIRLDAYAEGYNAGRTNPGDERMFIAIGMPLIGAGLAGGSWSRISSIIEARSRHFQPVVYLLDGKIPTT